VLSGRGLCDGLITRPEESYRLRRVVLCDQEISKNEEAKARYRAVENTTTMGCNAKKTNNKQHINNGQNVSSSKSNIFNTGSVILPAPWSTVICKMINYLDKKLPLL
jgi:hypothetical protein